jgi:hypothetical protein
MVSAPNIAAMPHKSEKTVSPVVKPTNKSLKSDFLDIFVAMTSTVHIPCCYITTTFSAVKRACVLPSHPMQSMGD